MRIPSLFPALLMTLAVIPLVADQAGDSNAFLGRWNLNSVVLAKTGMPFTVITGSDGPGSGNVDGVNGDRPNILDPSILGMANSNPDSVPRTAAY